MSRLALYGHSFSSYTWKAQIALHALGLDYELRELDAAPPDQWQHPEYHAFVQDHGGPLGKFPVLADGARVVFESSSIIEYLDLHHPGAAPLIPAEPEAALAARTMDRVFDNYLDNAMQSVIGEYFRQPAAPDPAALEAIYARMQRTYRWVEAWLETRVAPQRITIVECAAAPALFYTDWVSPIDPAACPRLAAWRAELNAMPEVARCIEAARPYRPLFPPGAPNRD